MITQLSLAFDFKAVPWLVDSKLMQHNPTLNFSLDKPNVIVGPNGSGKSALLTLLSIQTLTYLTGVSSMDTHYTNTFDLLDAAWTKSGYHEYTFLKGLEIETDKGPALYYRPNHVPGNWSDPTHAMMAGYYEAAKIFRDSTHDKSSGQGASALLQRMYSVLNGQEKLKYHFVNWLHKGGFDPKPRDERYYVGELPYKEEKLKDLYREVADDAIQLLLMDEPEQSLDAVSELSLWRNIQHADLTQTQIIVATHSFYPFMHGDSFNLIEAVPGYVETVKQMFKL